VGKTAKNIFTFTHFDAWTYGTNLINIDLLKSDLRDPPRRAAARRRIRHGLRRRHRNLRLLAQHLGLEGAVRPEIRRPAAQRPPSSGATTSRFAGPDIVVFRVGVGAHLKETLSSGPPNFRPNSSFQPKVLRKKP